MRFLGFFLVASLIAASNATAGWIQFVDSADPNAMMFDVYRGTYADASWEVDFANDESSTHWGLMTAPVAGIDWDLDSYDVVREGSVGENAPLESHGPLGVYPFPSDLSAMPPSGVSKEPFSPTRLRMPEPVSMIVWAILGAAWAGLAWHRRPIHRGSQWTGQFPIEEGTRWSRENRQAILEVIKKNRS